MPLLLDASPTTSAAATGRAAADGRDVDLLVLGEVNPDIIVHAPDPRPIFGQVERWVDGIELVIGSSSVIAACGAARLGLRVAIAGVVGDDAFGRFMLAAMRDHGLDTSAVRVDPAVPTGATVILASATDRAILTAAGTIPLLRAADVPQLLLARARHVHAGSVFLLDALRPDLPALFRAVRVRGGTTSADTNWDPSGSWDVLGLLAETDVFLPNAGEATRIARVAGIESADAEGVARALVALGPRVVAVKLGREGALAADAEGRVARCLALPVDPVDAIGAGDSFDAGFLAGWLGGRSLEACLAIAVACGSLSTRAAGGTASQPTLAEAEAAARVAGLLP